MLTEFKKCVNIRLECLGPRIHSALPKLKAAFTDETETVEVNGFYCGEGIYKVRFMPRKPGIWTATTRSNDPALDGIALTCACSPAQPGNHGRVLPRNEVRPQSAATEEDKFHFAYEDGARFQPFGTTCYAWVNQAGSGSSADAENIEIGSFQQGSDVHFSKVLRL